MRRAFRYILIAVAIIIVVLIALPFFINANSFRPTIESKLSTALGRPTQVGDLKLSILSGGLTAQNLAIADDPAFSQAPFLKAKSLSVGVDMWPLIFSRALRINSLTIEQPEVVLLRSRTGTWNFATLGSKSAPSATPSGGAPPDFSVKRLTLSNGRISVGTVGMAKQTHYEDVSIEMRDVSLAAAFPFTLSAKLPGGGSAKIDGHAGPLDRTDASLTPLDAKVDVTGLDLGATGFVDPSAGLGGLVDYSGTLASKSGHANMRGQLKATRLQLVKGGTPAKVPVQVDYASDYDLNRKLGVINASTVHIGQAAARISGAYDLGGSSAVLNAKILGQNMPLGDLQAMLPALGVVLPPGAALQGGTMDTNLAVAGPVEKLVTTGTLGMHKTRLTGFDLGSRMKAVAALAGVSTGTATDIELFTSNLRVAPEGILVQGLNFVAPAIGELTGNGTVSSGSAMDFKMAAKLNTAAGTTGALAKMVGMGGKNATVPFLIKGTTSDPKFMPDMAGLVKSNLPTQLSSPMDKLGLGGLFGGKKKKPQ